MNAAKIFKERIKAMPPGMDRAVLSILQAHVGEINAIKKERLAADLNRMGFGNGVPWETFERQMRISIANLRDQGIPAIASSGGAGYCIAQSWAEFNRFIDAEIDARIITLSQRKHHMISQAETFLGPRPASQGQGSLF